MFTASRSMICGFGPSAAKISFLKVPDGPLEKTVRYGGTFCFNVDGEVRR
ncbi:hypothetical protein [Streptomyces sp. NPDC046759]